MMVEASPSGSQLQLAVDAGAVLGSWIWNIPANLVVGDGRLAGLFGVDPEKVAGGLPLETFIAAIHPDDRDKVAAAIAAATRDGTPFRAEYRLTGNGRTDWVEAIGQVERDDFGRPVRFPGILFDITDRKRAEAAKRLGHDRFFAAVNRTGSATGALIAEKDWAETPLGPAEAWPNTLRSAVGICLNSRFPVCIYWGPDHVMLYNDPFSAIPGGKHPWALGRPAREAWSDIWSIIGPMFSGIMATGIAVHTEDGLLPMQRHGFTEECYFNYNVSPIYGEDGKVAGLFNAVIETSFRVIAERRASLLRNLADSRTVAATPEGACAAAAAAIAADPEDMPFCLIYLHEDADRAVLVGTAGLTPGSALSPKAIDLSTENPIWPVREAAADIIIHDLAGHETTLPPWPEKLREACIAPIADPAHPAAIAGFLVAGISPRQRPDDAFRGFISAAAGHIATAVAHARAAEQDRRATEALEARFAERSAELARTQAALVQSQKMEAVGQLTGGLAHDFNNLLTGIAGSLELLATRISQGRTGELDRYIAAAQGAAKRAAALTHRLLAFSRRQTLDPKATSLNRLVAGMEDLIRRTVGPAIQIEVVTAAGLWSCLVDPPQLESALLNLCINARDAMPDGGRLTIETGNRWLDDRTARDRDLLPGQYVSLCVSDTGIGMTPEIIQRAFDPFFTTKPIGQGTGLGLSMIYGFARQSGGLARIYSEPGQGAMVCLYLPRHHGADETADATDAVVPSPGRTGGTVLVVDDEPTVRMLVAEVLEDLGLTAIEAGDGAAGLKVIESPGQIDLLITDVGLPGGLNGRQVADAARALRPDLKVLFITGYAENAVLGHGHLAHGMQVLTKPFAMEDLAIRVQDFIVNKT